MRPHFGSDRFRRRHILTAPARTLTAEHDARPPSPRRSISRRCSPDRRIYTTRKRSQKQILKVLAVHAELPTLTRYRVRRCTKKEFSRGWETSKASAKTEAMPSRRIDELAGNGNSSLGSPRLTNVFFGGLAQCDVLAGRRPDGTPHGAAGPMRTWTLAPSWL